MLERLDNKFLSHIREIDAIALVVRCFEAVDVTSCQGIDPLPTPRPSKGFPCRMSGLR